MTTDYVAEFKALSGEYKGLQENLPKTISAFGSLHKVAFGEGELSTKEKELIALGIGIAMRCEGCVISHTRSALRAGASKADIAETVGVAIAMGGGPASVYGGKAIAAAEQFNHG